MQIKDRKIIGLIILLGALLFIPFTGGVHLFDWDEVNFAEAAREMIMTGDYTTVQINYEPFWEKPPLFFWMQSISMHLFGINEFAARFPNAIGGIITLIILFLTGRKEKNKTFASLWVISYAGSVLPFFYFKSGIIDPWFNLFIFTGVYFIYRYFKNPPNRVLMALLAGIFIGLATLTKGPAAIVITGLTGFIFLIIKKFRIPLTWRDTGVFILSLALTGGAWFIIQIANGQYDVIIDFIVYQIRLFQTQDAGHGGFPLYHFVVLLVGVFPASVFAIRRFRKKKEDNPEPFRQWMLILFWVVLILFSIVRTKIVHYSSLCYFPLTYLAALSLHKWIQEKIHPPRYVRLLLPFLASIYLIATIAVLLIDYFKEFIIREEMINDPFALANLQANVSWSGYEFLPAFVLLTVIFIATKKKITRSWVVMVYGATILFTYSTIILYVPRLEAYIQRTAIEYYKEVSYLDAYLTTLGFKSYGYLFYGDIQPPEKEQAFNEEWLLKGPIDKDAYFVIKSHKVDLYKKSYPELQILSNQNGYALAIRKHQEKQKTDD